MKRKKAAHPDAVLERKDLLDKARSAGLAL